MHLCLEVRFQKWRFVGTCNGGGYKGQRSSSPSWQLKLAKDGGIAVDMEMRTSAPHVYAAGDVCTVEWDSQPKLWFQVSLCVCVFLHRCTC